MTEKYFKNDAKQIVDTLFDAKIFIPELTRDELNGLEELIQFLIKSRFDSHLRAEKLFSKINEKPCHTN